MPFDVDGTVVVVVVVATAPDGGAKADAAATDCACKTLFSATEKLVRVSITFASLTSSALRRRSLIARMSRMLLFSGACRALPSESTS